MDTTRNAFISATSLAPIISESEDEIISSTISSTTLYQTFDETIADGGFYSTQHRRINTSDLLGSDLGNFSGINHQEIEDCIGIVMETVNRG